VPPAAGGVEGAGPGGKPSGCAMRPALSRNVAGAMAATGERRQLIGDPSVTTRTKSKPSPTTELDRLVAEADALAAESVALGDRHAAAVNRIDQLRAARLTSQVEQPEEWTDRGPAAGSAAAMVDAELREAVEDLERADFVGQRQAADQRVADAKDRIVRHKGAHARELIAALDGEAQEAVEAFNRWASEGGPLLAHLVDVSNRATAILTAAGVPFRTASFDHAATLVSRLGETRAPWPLPRIED
jgi:hypothetical protein